MAPNLHCPEASSSSGSNPRHWNTLWSLEIPKKIKIFMWRTIRNLLPLVENLRKRKVLQEPSCQRCKRNVESIYHALVDCKTAKKIWNHGSLAVPPPNTHLQDVLSFFLGMTNNLRKSELELMVVYCWSVWHSRNKFIFEG